MGLNTHANGISVCMSQVSAISEYNTGNKRTGGFGATVAGYFVSSAVIGISEPFTQKVLIPQLKKNGQLSEDKIELIHKAAEQALHDSGVDNKGVNIRRLSKIEPDTPSTIRDLLEDFSYMQNNKLVSMVKNGENAFFLMQDLPGTVYKKNTILMPEKDLSPQVFHEIGHSINHNLSKFGLILQKCRGVSLIGPAMLALYGICTRKNEPDENGNLSKLQKANNFIRNNIGKLSFALTLPMLLEEGMASIRGEKLAKKLLDKDMMKYIKKGNLIGYASYVCTAALLSLSSYLGVKVKDRVLENKSR